jgi:hypothetical protein
MEAGRTAVGHLRRAGTRDYLATAILNITDVLIHVGDWDTAETEQNVSPDEIDDTEGHGYKH